MSLGDLVLSNPRRRAAPLLAATATLALLRLAPAYAAEEKDPLAVDEYAKAYGVGEGAAVARIALQEKAAGVANALEARLGPDYAGVWFDNADGVFVVPIVSKADAGAVDKQFAAYGIGQAGYRTTLVDSTIEELEAAQAALAEEAAKGPLANGRARMGIDPSINSVVVEIDSEIAADQRAAVRAQVSSSPVAVKLVELPAKAFDDRAEACSWNNEPRRACDPPFHGGVEIWNDNTGFTCTSGFAMTGNANGNTFVATAGHCFPSNLGTWWAQTSNGFEAALGAWENSYFGSGNADAGLIRVKDTSWWVKEWGWRGHVVIWGSPGTPETIQNPSNPINGSQSSYVGEYVCHSGRTTGSSCGTVQQLNVKVSYGGTSLNHMTKVNGACGNEGDSGGPVYAGNYAVGIWSGGEAGTCGNHYYTEVREIESVYAVHVTTW
jgi:Trypsin/Alpha-lytic protease prodomain